MTDNKTSPLMEAINALQLPFDPSRENEALDEISDLASKVSQSRDDLAVLLNEAADDWAASGNPNSLLRETINRLLGEGISAGSPIDGKTYLKLHKSIRNGTRSWMGLSHALASRLLSRTTLIHYLLRVEKFSCTQVARLLYATEASLDVPYQAVAVIASKLGLLPELNEEAVLDTLREADQGRNLALFPDGSILESCATAALEVAKWAPEFDLENSLRALSRHGEGIQGGIFWPYLQIIHWCCIPIEFFDHPASYLYEFAPRGKIAQTIFEPRKTYPTHTNNPVLNNAKAVQTLNASWARNRGGDNAQALVGILSLLESLPFGARRQVGRIVRAWLYRIIELQTIQLMFIQDSINIEAIERVVESVINSESSTGGVIEQRVVDALSLLAFQKQNWRPKGIGDSVNASNFSKHKLGDVEFANVANREAIALEAHGGHLSVTYVANHRRSLSRIIEQRLAESWAAIDDPTKWSISVVFVAHSRDETELPQGDQIHGVRVSYEYWDYRKLSEEANKNHNPPRRREVFNEHIIKALNQPTVRENVREKFRELAGL